MPKWEYIFITCRTVESQWVPQYINSQELPKWKSGPRIHEVANQLGEQGWELVNFNVTGDAYRVVFKRQTPPTNDLRRE